MSFNIGKWRQETRPFKMEPLLQQLLNEASAHSPARECISRGRAVPDKKPEHVDLIQEATRQNLPRTSERAVIQPDIKEKRRLSHWPPAHIEEWRADLAPWRVRSRKFRDRD